MRNNRPLVPGFLKKMDADLLKNSPAAWSERTHLVLWFCLVAGVVLTLISFLIFNDARQYSTLPVWIGFISVLAFIGFIFWLIFLLRFNVFKRYGNRRSFYGLKSFLAYFISIGAMIAVVFIPPAVETFNANRSYSNDEIIRDINELNLNATWLEYNIIPKDWKQQKYLQSPVDYRAGADAYTEPAIVSNNYYYLDSVSLKEKIADADSVIRTDDSTYVFYEVPDYRFVYSYNADDYSSVHLLTSRDIFFKIVNSYKPPDRSVLIKRMKELQVKYEVPDPYYYSQPDHNAAYDIKIRAKYRLNQINNGINNIVDKKYFFREGGNTLLRVWFYTTLILALLVFILRHSTNKAFFLSLLTVFLLMVITSLFAAVSRTTSISFLTWILIYYIISGVLALLIRGASKRYVAHGIALNIFTFFTPFLPLFITAYIFEILDERNYTTYKYDNLEWFFYAEICGIVLLILVLQPLTSKLYKRWYSLPED